MDLSFVKVSERKNMVTATLEQHILESPDDILENPDDILESPDDILESLDDILESREAV